nr:hypothetical protein [uncultured bacterium]
MKKILHFCGAFIVSVLAASVAASIFSTQFVLAGLQNLGVRVSLNTRLEMTFNDLAILQTLGIVIAASFLIGFLTAALCKRFIGGNQMLWYVLAGGCSVLSALLIMSAVLQLMPVAGARTTFGLLTQTLAGAFGGYVFARLALSPQTPVKTAGGSS